MDPTISVAKGCFVYKNGATRASKTAKKSPSKRRRVPASSVLGKEITEQPFYNVYSDLWRRFQSHIEELQQHSSKQTLEDLVTYISNGVAHSRTALYGLDEVLPAAALLTGINQPDHLEQFETLSDRIHQKMSANVCVLQARDCPTVKAAVESMVYNFMEAAKDDEDDRDHKRLRKSQCNIKLLRQWYANNYTPAKGSRSSASVIGSDAEVEGEMEEEASISSHSRDTTKSRASHALVVILPDFECFSAPVLQDLILILSSHCKEMPFVLIMGIATAVSAVHSTLPYHVTSKMALRIFQTPTAPHGLNEILDKVILSPKYAFHLSGKAFKFLTHIFLYYDFSINGFIQGFKYCLMEHFFQGNAFALCSDYSVSLARIKSLTHDDMETIRRLISFRPYVENINDCKRIIAVLTDDDYLKKKLPQLLRNCHIHFMLFRVFLEFLLVLVGDLPKCPLGKYRRELYALCLAKDITGEAEFNECWHILSFMSKDEFVAKISKAIKATEDFCKQEIVEFELADQCERIANEILSSVKELLTKVVMAGMEVPKMKNAHQTPADLKKPSSRHELKEQLLQMSKQEKSVSEFTKSVNETLTFIQSEIIVRHLCPLQSAPTLHELFVFSDIQTVRRNIIGAPRAALHMALNNPHFYLQCKCCHLEDNNQLLATLPDLSVAYKLHLECGRMINLYDWLQAFRAVVDFDEDEQQEQVDPQIQARFTRAVAELQFLGYIKMSKRKTDHATRLTW